MDSSRRWNWATYLFVAIVLGVALATVVVVMWRSAPRSWQQMAADAEQERQDAERQIDETFANVSDEVALPVRKRLERAMVESNAGLVADDLDLELQMKIVLFRMDVVGRRAERLMPALLGDSDPTVLAQHLLGEAMQGVQAGGSYEFLRSRRREGRTTAVYRLVGADGRVNYHEWAFARGSDGKTKIIDLYIYAMGEWFTDTMRRMFEIGRIAEVRLTPQEREEAEANSGRIAEAAILARAKDRRGVDDAVSKLPEKLRNDKLVLILQAFASSEDASRFRKDFARLEERYPDDAATSLLGHGLYTLDGRYDEALAAIDRVDNAVGGDPYLAALRTETLALAGRFAEARAEGERALAADDPPPNVYLALAYAAAAERSFDEAVRRSVEYVEATPNPDDSLADFEHALDGDVWQDLFQSPAWRAQLSSE